MSARNRALHCTHGQPRVVNRLATHTVKKRRFSPVETRTAFLQRCRHSHLPCASVAACHQPAFSWCIKPKLSTVWPAPAIPARRTQIQTQLAGTVVYVRPVPWLGAVRQVTRLHGPSTAVNLCSRLPHHERQASPAAVAGTKYTPLLTHRHPSSAGWREAAMEVAHHHSKP